MCVLWVRVDGEEMQWKYAGWKVVEEKKKLLDDDLGFLAIGRFRDDNPWKSSAPYSSGL